MASSPALVSVAYCLYKDAFAFMNHFSMNGKNNSMKCVFFGDKCTVLRIMPLSLFFVDGRLPAVRTIFFQFDPVGIVFLVFGGPIDRFARRLASGAGNGNRDSHALNS